MFSQRWQEVCRPAQTIPFTASNCCAPAAGLLESPIDHYLDRTSGILILGTPAAIDGNPSLARLILLGIVSEVESYFKQAVGQCVRACELCRDAASSHMIPFAAIDYYGEDVESALVESVSFSTAGEIIKQTRKLTGLELASGGLNAAIKQFDSVCHLRHAAVHASGHLGTGNIREIAMPARARLQVHLRFADIQTIIAICHNLVREYNRTLFVKLIDRWVDQKKLTGAWQKDREQFTSVFRLFRCARDLHGPVNAYAAYRNLQPIVRRRLAKSP